MSVTAHPRRSRRKPWRQALVLLCLAALPPVSQAAEPELTLQHAVELALAGNPGLAEIKARAQALAAVPPQAGAMPDPTFNVDLLNVPTRSFSLRQEDMTMLEFGVSQTIPFPGKRDLQRKIAEEEALAAADSVEEARLRLVREVKDGWWRLFFYDRALNVTQESEQFFQQLVDTAQAQYRVGQGQQQDVQLAQLELSKLKDERLELIGMRHAATAQFNVLLDRPPSTLVVLPASAEFAQMALQESNLLEKAQEIRPLLAQRRKMLDAAKTRVDLAQKDFYPDVTVGASYAVRQDTPTGQSRSDFASIRLSVNLPIYAGDKQSKAVDQRQSEYLQEQYAFEDEHHRVQAEITAKTAEYLHAKERLSLYEHEIIPQARQTVRSLMAGYPVGKADFTDLLKAQLTLFQYQTQYWQSLTRTQQILAEVAAATGLEVAHD
ncbi:Outer membrane protein TolC [Methylomagnum ishizawai]|uniref:Outer membrane protein TolC n=1 Tax=Methylomagnum ishizawai TaxID=1760988 RepID=A0A1Y6CXK2_9GAMM|nr:TolC family protein [Methylomagnum ishizawai]SMF95006.1 Outer membrane protein TolC [Methylomagnum ishizawai]